MRISHVIMKLDSPLRDFANGQADHMVLSGKNPDYRFKGGWRYRLDLETLEGLPVLKMTGTRRDLVAGEEVKTTKVRYFGALGAKEINPWTKEDDALEAAFEPPPPPLPPPAKGAGARAAA